MDSKLENNEVEERIIIRKPPCNCSILHKIYNTVNAAYKIGQLTFQQDNRSDQFQTCVKTTKE
ncbi:unnamed protein product [Paramecium primaurelia]|uniref:Uncharacterized protein n=1 Tax=Paramecium primaurelia TaxID=5886 RepID=A0A8S1KVJ1_PARPR|nr:unnamed protein product [Paramecium primaurelia]